MATVTRRCAVCTTPVGSASIFCTPRCQKLGRVIRDAQPDQLEDFTLADEPDVHPQSPILEHLEVAGRRHRMRVTTILAAYTRADMELDAMIWAAHSRGMSERDIGSALEMRTASVGRRILSFQARLHGPAGPAKSSQTAS